MRSLIIEACLSSDTKLFLELKKTFPLELLQSELAGLAKKYQERFQELMKLTEPAPPPPSAPPPPPTISPATELADLIRQAQHWAEVEAAIAAYPEYKTEAWQLLGELEKARLKELKQQATTASIPQPEPEVE